MKIPRSDTGMRKAIALLFGDERGVNRPADLHTQTANETANHMEESDAYQLV